MAWSNGVKSHWWAGERAMTWPPGRRCLAARATSASVVLDVFEHVHVEDRVERLRVVELLRACRAGSRSMPASEPERISRSSLADERGVGFQADPAPLGPPAEDAGRPAEPGADFEDVLAEIRRELVAEVRLPVLRRREQVELGADIVKAVVIAGLRVRAVVIDPGSIAVGMGARAIARRSRRSSRCRGIGATSRVP